ncbi:MAG: DedA family protein [Patescibacteria group bacterium]|nr:DedA family protein [Patescibacteria group bacterium]MDE1965786.1 DedA family protein [Patescibacteria group bacterium]
MYPLITGLVAFVEASRYGLLFVSTLFGSPVVMIAAGYLIHAGQLDFWLAYATIVSADIVGDIGWYWIGRIGARPFLLRFGHYFGLTEELIARLEERFLKYHARILIINKLTMGFGIAIATLAVAGMMRVPFFRYLAINVSGELLWAIMPIAIGFYFGNLTDYIPASLRLVSLAVALVAAILFMRYGLKRLAKKEW